MQSAQSGADSSLELEDDALLEDEDEVGTGARSANRKPHFLDYDNKPPAGLEDQVVFPRPTPAATTSNGTSEEVNGRGTWPAATSGGAAAKYNGGGRQNHSMYGDMSEVCPKMECVYSLLSMLGSTNSLEMSAKFMELSRNRETCSALRRSGCIPLLVQIIHNDPNETARRNARQSLNNVIGCHPDDKAGRREVKVLKLIEQLVDYSDQLRDYSETESATTQPDPAEDPEKHPIAAITTLMKISFDEEHRHAMCQLGALQTISTLIQLDHAVHGANPSPAGAPKCVTMRRYAGMILTNLTFGDGNNKSLLCSNKGFMRALVAQIGSSSDELVQVTASVLRNLSWRADAVIKQTLSEIGTVAVLARAAMVCTIENTLKAILSALWNLSNHCPPNRSEFCEVPGALEFLIDMLSYEAPSKTMHVIENAGGILRNISSHVALREDYRRILRRKSCLKILLEQLKSPSLTVVSNACGTLGSLSGECAEDQRFLRENGAIPMLRSLIYSKHKMISNGSSMALKNLLKPTATSASVSSVELSAPPTPLTVATTLSGPTSDLPSLNARKKKALEQELEEKFLPPKASPDEKDVCTVRKDDDVEESEGNSEEDEDDEVVSHSGVHIRLVANQPEEPDSEKPVNYSLKEDEVTYQDYQETDIDQITDYSLRYAENQSEESETEADGNKRGGLNRGLMAAEEEDSVRCYYTEGTPQIISSATSMSDLRGVKATATVAKSVSIPISGGKAAVTAGGVATATPGRCDTPDKPYNYCEEGTPDFSRDASLNVLELSGDPKLPSTKPISPLDQPDIGVEVSVGLHQDQDALPPSTPGGGHHHNTSKQVSFLNTAEETPLMFSRTSSMGSLSSAEPALVCADDKSSIVSEFSRFPSGVISPSELPDSPTQSMPHSPRRSSGMMGQVGKRKEVAAAVVPPPVKSAFEDTVAKFEVENTPAAFSCATSLSNLSLEEREDQESKEVVTVVTGPPVLPIPEVSGSGSDDGESDAGGDDDLLLQSMVSMGMKKERPEPPEEPDRDQLRAFCTEDTPARLSEAPSNCDLSVLSFDTRNDTGTDLGPGGHDSDDSSNVSAEQSDRLLEECIRSGMPQPKAPKENPLGMMRRNPVHLVEPLYANDEVNNFYLEDSPYAFSTISGLSDLTVATEAAEGRKQISTLGTSRAPIPAPPQNRNGSLSSLSVESDADDRLLDEAIAAGIGSNSKRVVAAAAPVNRMRAAAVDGNDSLDSIDSVDSNDPQGNSLLEQCIANGMKKPPAEKHTAELRAGMNFAQLARGGGPAAISMPPPPHAPPTDFDSIPDSDRDYDLLRECIARGMPRNSTATISGSGGVSTLELTQNLQRLAISTNANAAAVPLSSSVPKNVDTTPVVVTRPDAGAIRNVTSAGVVQPAAAVDNTILTVNGTTTTISTTINMARSDPGRASLGMSPQPQLLQQSGSELDRSNEFPATSMMTSSKLLVESMQMSNEFTADLVPTTTSDKHKDPDLMLKSVERLTQELVSTAASKAENCCNSSSNANNGNTWDEDVTCANDVSFPSLSVQAPRIQYSESVTASVTSGTMSYGGVEEDETATISEEIDSKALDALEDQTPMNEERPLPGFVGSNEDLSLQVDEIHFQLGGEVKHPMVGGHLTAHGRPSDVGISFSTTSTLTNSTIIAIEATKVANQLQNMAIVESADVDLSKINCPFAGSDSILISDCSDSEMTFRNELSGRKIPTLPAGLVARRALGQTTFNDSMNSLHNLDSIGPPSIMDELMDSMISVASITSEVVDLDSGHADVDRAGSSGNSSLTLNSSSLENLIKFSPTMNAGMVVTPGGPGLGMGCKSTPMSPKRAERRQAMKDRYKTYTIPNAAELLVDLEQKKEEGGSGGEEVKTPTPSVPSTPSPKKSSKERRAENKSRYETQVITTGSLSNGYHGPTIDPDSPRTPPARATIIATPVAFSPLTLQSPAPMSLERVLSPEDPDVDDDPVTYTIQETTPRRKSFEQKLPTIASSTGLPPVPQQVRSPLASPSKMPTPARIVAKINPPTPTPTQDSVVKTVRGTKKPAYVSPYRKTVVSAPAVIARTPAAPLPAAKKEPLATPKLRSQTSLVETRTRPQPLRARSSIGSKRNSLELNGAGSVRSSISSTSSTDIPKIRERQPSLGAIGGAKAKVAPSPEPLLIRQGTFTKDEPTNPEVPVVTSAPSTPAKTARKPGTGSMIPSSASSSRLTTIAKSRIVLHKSISMDASKAPSTPTAASAGPPSGESTPLTSRFRLTSARTSLVDYKKPNTTGGRLSTPVRSIEEGATSVPATPTSPGSMIPMRRKSGLALPKRTNLTMKSNPDVLKGKLEGVRNAFVRTAASGVKTGSR